MNSILFAKPTSTGKPGTTRRAWGSVDSISFMSQLDKIYKEAVHWRNNLLKIPQGNAGKSLTTELSRLFNAFATGSALEPIALKAATVLPHLILQKPFRNSKIQDHIKCMEKRLKMWSDGDLASLLWECRAIQDRLPKTNHNTSRQQQLSSSFANLMFQGKTNAALQLLSNKGKGNLLQLNDVVGDSTVKEILKSKHPSGMSAMPESTINGTPPDFHPVIFDSIDAALIKSTSLNTKGAAGPSGLDAFAWRRLCTSFKSACYTLCQSLALAARRLCTEYVDPTCVHPLLACRLIALDKDPGVRPIGIGETSRRIIAKGNLLQLNDVVGDSTVKEILKSKHNWMTRVTRGDIQDAAGSIQLCAGQITGVESAAHAVQECFKRDDTEAALLVDASNAFNSLNREAALNNIRFLCPSISTMLINTYRAPTELFINGEVIYSREREGTTQGDPLAMPMYAVATIPLIKNLPDSVTQVWYADDASALGSITNIRNWWDKLTNTGPSFGYHANPAKTWLVAKDTHLSEAITAFSGSNVNVTSVGHTHLGVPLGTTDYINHSLSKKVDQWCSELRLLSEIAITQPHAAFAAFNHGFSSKWSYLSRTLPDISIHFQPLENIIRTVFIPTVTGRLPPNDINRDMFALPARLGGLGLCNPLGQCDLEFSASTTVSGPLKDLILHKQSDYSYECLAAQINQKSTIKQLRREQSILAAEELKQRLSPTGAKVLALASEKGSSNWLTSLPIEEFGFSLHKGAFVDALSLRYGWPPPGTPTHCVCGENFSVHHVLSCPRGGFPSIRHNEIRDATANLLTEVCHDVMVEPDLQPLTGETMSHRTSNSNEGARLDIAVNGFWGGRYEKTFLDVRVLTRMPRLTATPASTTATGNTKRKRRGPMNSASLKSNTHRSHQLSFLQQGEWPSSLLHFTKG